MSKYFKRIQKMDFKILNDEIFKWIFLFENYNSISFLIKPENNFRMKIKVLLDPKFIFHSLGFKYFNNLKNIFKTLDDLKKFIEKEKKIKKLILFSKFENTIVRKKAYKYFYSKFMSIKKINSILFFNEKFNKDFISEDVFQEVIELINNKNNESNSDLIRETDFIIKISSLNSKENILLFACKSRPKSKLYKKIFSKELIFNPYKSKNLKILILFAKSLRKSNEGYLKKYENIKYKILYFSFDKKHNLIKNNL